MKEWKITPWSEELGAYTLPDGLRERLAPLSVEEQAKLFGAVTYTTPVPLDKSSDVLSLILCDGVIVGVMMSNAYGYPTPCYIGKCVCTWDAEDNNGAGYKTRVEYTQLVLLEGN